MSNKLEERSETLDRIHQVVQALTPFQALVMLWCINGMTVEEIAHKMDAIIPDYVTTADIFETIAEIRALARQIDNGQLVFDLWR